MILNDKDYAAIDMAASEYFKCKKVEQKCPRCSSNIVVTIHNNAYEVRCEKPGCIAERFRGI